MEKSKFLGSSNIRKYGKKLNNEIVTAEHLKDNIQKSSVDKEQDTKWQKKLETREGQIQQGLHFQYVFKREKLRK